MTGDVLPECTSRRGKPLRGALPVLWARKGSMKSRPERRKTSAKMVAPPSHLTPAWLARVDQFQLDRRNAENPDYRRFIGVFSDTVVMRCAGNAPDKAAGRYGNRTIGVEIGAAVHPPCARQNQTQPVGCVAVRCAHIARVPLHQHGTLPRVIQTAEKRRHITTSRTPDGLHSPFDCIRQGYLGFGGIDGLRSTGGQAERQSC